MKATKRRAVAGVLAMTLAALLQLPARAQEDGQQAGAGGSEEAAPVYRPPAAERGEVRTAALPLYVPPSLGMPGGRVGAGTRSAGRQYSIQVLAPDHVGLTTATQPTLYWYLASPTGARIDLTIRNGDAVEPVLDRPLRGPFTAGVHAVRLADYEVSLEPGKSYQWFVAVVPDPEKRSSDFVSGAWIRPDAPPAALRQRLETTPPERAVFVYAQSSLWYDAIASVSERIAVAPHDGSLRAQRAALLEQVGLSEVADYDRSQAGGR